MLVRTLMLTWKIFVSMNLRFQDSIMLRFYSEHVFDKWNKTVSHFKSLGLRCEITIMLQDSF